MIANSKGQFSNLFINSLDMVNETVDNAINRHEMIFFVIAGIVVLFMIFVISISKILYI